MEFDETYSVQRMNGGKWVKWRGVNFNNITLGYATHHLKELSKLGNACRIVKGEREMINNLELLRSPEAIAYWGLVDNFIEQRILPLNMVKEKN